MNHLRLGSGATLTLTQPSAHNFAVDFSGNGTVDLTADLVQNSATVLNLTSPSVLRPPYPSIDNHLRLTSRGTNHRNP